MGNADHATSHLPPERVVAFIDILGFQALIDRMSRDPRLYQTVEGSLQGILRSREVYAALGKTELKSFADVQIAHFSDCVVISKCVKPEAPSEASRVVALLTRGFAGELLREGIFVRGGIARGWMFHEGNILFGQGMVAAYRLESEVARVPRIVVSDDVVSDLTDFLKWWQLREDSDGFSFLDIFGELRPGAVGAPDAAQFQLVRGRIVSECSSAGARSELLSKYRWLARQFNSAVEREEQFWPGSLAGIHPITV